MSAKPHCWLCGRSAAKWGPLTERRGGLAHEDCWQNYDARLAETLAEAPPFSPETLAELDRLLNG